MGKTATRDGFGEALLEIAAQDKNVIAMDCDLGRSTRAFRITEVDPERFIEMGIAEQDMISTAVGLSLTGKIVFANSFAIFITGRAFDQIRQQVSLPGCNLKICGSSAGLTQGPDGATHQSVLDAALMRLLPNMTVFVPADPRQAKAAVWAAYKTHGPVYLRLSRFETGDFLPEKLEFIPGKIQEIRKGKNVALLGIGPVMKNVINTADSLWNDGFKCGVYNVHTLKPLDVEEIKKLAGRYKLLFTVEEHSIYGGLGSAVAEIIAEMSTDCRLIRLGVNDTFGESGTAEELLAKHGLSPEAIQKKVRRVYSESSGLPWYF